MKTSAPKEPVSGVINELEQQLSAARKEKTLAQVPALRRLRNVVRSYGLFGIVISLPSLVLTGVFLRGLYSAVYSQEPTLTSVSTFFLFAAFQWIVNGIGLLTMFYYLRFLKQFRENQVHDIKDTAAMILRVSSNMK